LNFIDTSEGDVKVNFDSDKAELTTKKLRKKAHKSMVKEMKKQLYGNFVKAGTLSGGHFDKEEVVYEEVKDLSKIKTLTDEDLVKACGGRTAHKGGRHGLNMNAKLSRVEQAERDYMEKFSNKLSVKPEENIDKSVDSNSNEDESVKVEQELNSCQDDGNSRGKKKKRKSKDHNKDADKENSESVTPVIKKKRKNKNRNEGVGEDYVGIDNDVTVNPVIKKKKRKNKELDDLLVLGSDPVEPVKKRKKKHKRGTGRS